MHILRTARCFDAPLVLRFGCILRDLECQLLSFSVKQANLSVRNGGLGWTAYSLASSAFLASAVSTSFSIVTNGNREQIKELRNHL